MRKSWIAICTLAIAALACQFLTGTPTPSIQNGNEPQITTPPEIPPSNSTAPSSTSNHAWLSQSGPWIIISKSDGLYAANLDGSGATKVFDITSYLKLDPSPYLKLSSIAPRGGRFAIVTADDPAGSHGLILHILHLPDGQEEKTIPLTGPKTEPGPDAQPGDSVFQNLWVFGTGQWSPDGSQLAFEGGMDGDSSDLYLYSTITGHVTRLTSGAAQDYAPSWSPDGKYIVHFGASTFGTGAGYSMVGAWATLVSKASTYDLYVPTSGGEDILGWLDPQTVIVYSFSAACSTQNVRAVDVATRKINPLWNSAFNQDQIAFDPISGAFMLFTEDFSSSSPACPGTIQQAGGYLVTKNGKATRVANNTNGIIHWAPEANAFFHPDGGVIVATHPDGSKLTTPIELTESPSISPDGKIYAWKNPNGGIDLYINNKTQTVTDVEPVTPVSPIGVGGNIYFNLPSILWNNNSGGFVFISDGQLYSAHASNGFVPTAMTNVDAISSGQFLFKVNP